MASTIDIANLALSHLGDDATVASIDPPEGSAQAEHCARFYPSSLASMLEMHNWRFCLRRIALAAVTNPSATWAYAYAVPSDMLAAVTVLDPNNTDDYQALNERASQDYDMETTTAGDVVLLTNQADAVLRYKVLVTDTAKFPPLFVEALSWLLASKLAGPLLKGDSGRKAALDCTKAFAMWWGKAVASDASQRQVTTEQTASWVAAR